MKDKCPPNYPSSIHHLCDWAGGNISIDFSEDLPLERILKQTAGVELGGKWAPKDCNARFRIAVIIPYRDRYRKLLHVTHNAVLHVFLGRFLNFSTTMIF